jgi:hypothetical protein
VQPSSLIFLVLIAIWAAFLLQHWVRRREYLATARSVDRFSDAMHVLERRSPLPEYELSGPRPRSYDISPARPSRPEVVVKRAHSLRPDTPTVPAAVLPGLTAPDAPVRPTRFFRVLAGVSARRVRGLSLLGSFSFALVVSPLAAVSILPWWSFLVVVAVLLADLAWLRRVAVSERVARRAQVQARRSPSRSAHAAARHPDYFESEPESSVESRSEPVVEAPVTIPAEISEPVQAPAQVDPSAWAPVPVPPPTYTLKAKAADPVVVPNVVTEPEGAQYWRLDGMVYDCELDELVERRSATGA